MKCQFSSVYLESSSHRLHHSATVHPSLLSSIPTRTNRLERFRPKSQSPLPKGRVRVGRQRLGTEDLDYKGLMETRKSECSRNRYVPSSQSPASRTDRLEIARPSTSSCISRSSNPSSTTLLLLPSLLSAVRSSSSPPGTPTRPSTTRVDSSAAPRWRSSVDGTSRLSPSDQVSARHGQQSRRQQRGMSMGGVDCRLSIWGSLRRNWRRLWEREGRKLGQGWIVCSSFVPQSNSANRSIVEWTLGRIVSVSGGTPQSYIRSGRQNTIRCTSIEATHPIALLDTTAIEHVAGLWILVTRSPPSSLLPASLLHPYTCAPARTMASLTMVASTPSAPSPLPSISDRIDIASSALGFSSSDPVSTSDVLSGQNGMQKLGEYDYHARLELGPEKEGRRHWVEVELCEVVSSLN